MSGRRAGMSAVACTVLAVGVLLLMVMFAARSGPERIFAGPLHDPHVGPINPSYTPPTLPVNPNGGNHEGLFHSNPFFDAVGWLLRIAILACVLWLLQLVAKRVVAWLQDHRRRRRPQSPEHVDFDLLDDPDPLVEEMRKDADEQFQLLLGGQPRNAIVACWDRFEEQAERMGSARHAWETSSEFTIRLFDQVSADPVSVSRLESLYREARFSEHEVGEDQRQSAVAALRGIHASLGIGARA